jgi:AcrR family transcriptional regulator
MMAQRTKGEETRAAILGTAVDIASVEGLEGLTIGRLAKELDMSKSGLFGHFGSKEDLQLATVRAARRIFIREVLLPTQEAAEGLPRIWALCDAWLSYMERGVFRGGCFFFAVSAEFDNRPGPVRDAIAANMKEWLDYLAQLIREAQQRGEITADHDPDQIAFELHGYDLSANWAMQLYGDTQAPNRARFAILNRLHSITTNPVSSLPPQTQYSVR